MIEISGGCDKCGLLTQEDYITFRNRSNKLICQNCWDKYFSEEAIRDAKLNKLLKQNSCRKLVDFGLFLRIRKYKNTIRNFVFQLLDKF
jgi:hypothetical protein